MNIDYTYWNSTQDDISTACQIKRDLKRYLNESCYICLPSCKKKLGLNLTLLTGVNIYLLKHNAQIFLFLFVKYLLYLCPFLFHGTYVQLSTLYTK